MKIASKCSRNMFKIEEKWYLIGILRHLLPLCANLAGPGSGTGPGIPTPPFFGETRPLESPNVDGIYLIPSDDVNDLTHKLRTGRAPNLNLGFAIKCLGRPGGRETDEK